MSEFSQSLRDRTRRGVEQTAADARVEAEQQRAAASRESAQQDVERLNWLVRNLPS